MRTAFVETLTCELSFHRVVARADRVVPARHDVGLRRDRHEAEIGDQPLLERRVVVRAPRHGGTPAWSFNDVRGFHLSTVLRPGVFRAARV